MEKSAQSYINLISDDNIDYYEYYKEKHCKDLCKMDNETLSPEIQENQCSPPESKEDASYYECNSYSYSVSLSNNYFGFNIFELYTKEQLEKLCRDPIANNSILREISTTLYGTSGTYTNTVDYLTAIATLDKVIVPHGKSKSKKARNKELALEVCRSIKDKEFVRDALFKGMIDGIAFYYFETISRPLSQKRTMSDYEVQTIIELNESDLNVSIITLPTDYCRIIGIKNGFYVVAFNMDYFRYPEGGTIENKLRKYPKEIRDAYGSEMITYVVSALIGIRTLSVCVAIKQKLCKK